MPKDLTSRRGFLAALVPIAAAVAVPAATAATPKPPPRLRREDQPHDPRKAARGRCDCRACVRERCENPGNVPHAAAVLALYALDVALSRLTREHCPDGVEGCDVCRDANGCYYVVGYGIAALEGELIFPDDYDARRKRALVPDAGLPADEAALVALNDAMDALLDLGAGHCAGWDCGVCEDADGLVYHLRSALDLIGGSVRLSLAVARRELQSALRKVAREAEGGGLYPHTAAENNCGEAEVAHYRLSLELLEARAVKP